MISLSRFKNKRSLVTVGGMVILVVLFLAYLVLESPTQSIVYTDSGYQPSQVSIEVGTKVIFKNKSDIDFWPASNVHPTHSAYPDFDPRQPIPPGESWAYTFDELGSYRFHDHIRSTEGGVITVVSNKLEPLEIDCTTTKTVSCWEDLILETLEKQGVSAAFALLVELVDTEPAFSYDCHGYSHIIGEEAFELFQTDESFTLSPATVLCGYGFYHGFMETLLQTTGDIELAREFCTFADAQLKGKAAAASTACYHGTGHGAVDGSDPSAWGDANAMMAPGFALCSILAENDFQDYLCATGVFNAIEILSSDDKYSLAEVRKNPFAVCKEQPEKYREPCYSNMLPAVLELVDNDIAKAAEYINQHMINGDALTIDGYTVNEMVTLGLFFEYIRINLERNSNYIEEGVALCRVQPEEDHLSCIAGLSGGHIKYGNPGQEFEQNLIFCAYDDFSIAEKTACYTYFVDRLQNQYDTTTQEYICSQVPEAFKGNSCTINL